MSTVTYRALKSSICFERRTSFGMGKCVRVCWLGGGGGGQSNDMLIKSLKKNKKPETKWGSLSFRDQN